MSITALLDPFTSILTIWNSLGGRYASVSAFRSQKDMNSIQSILENLTSNEITNRQDIYRIEQSLNTILNNQNRNDRVIQELQDQIENYGISFLSLVEALNKSPFGAFLVDEASDVISVERSIPRNSIKYSDFYGVIENLSHLSDCDILSSAFVPANETITSIINKDPKRYFWHVTNLKEGIFRPNDEGMVPVIFNIGEHQYLGWQKEDVIKSDFGIEIDNSKWKPEVKSVKNPFAIDLTDVTLAKHKSNMQTPNIHHANYLYRCFACSYLLGVQNRNEREYRDCPRCGGDILVGKEIIPSFVLS